MVLLGGPDVSPTGDGTVPPPRQPGDSDHDRAGLAAGISLALQALYANDAVKRAFVYFD